VTRQTGVTGRPEDEVWAVARGESVGTAADVGAGKPPTGVGLPASELTLADDHQVGVGQLEGDSGPGDLGEMGEAAGTDPATAEVGKADETQAGGARHVKGGLVMEEPNGFDRPGPLGGLESGAGLGGRELEASGNIGCRGGSDAGDPIEDLGLDLRGGGHVRSFRVVWVSPLD
jgi:hypothetical protein